jgi:hypothetical protein
MEMDLKDYLYVCYSVNLYNRFKNNKIKYFIKGLNESTNKNFWIYPRTHKVEEILIDWTNGVGK